MERPSLLQCSEPAANNNNIWPSDLLLQEAQICEILKKSPHPKIVEYFGCVLQGEQIVGLCFKRYKINLAERIEDTEHPLDRDMCLKGIKEGIKHLHSLGLIHNDLKSSNIMLNAYDVPIIADYDSCRREEDRLGRARDI
ncbi:MAG: hypothetical protein M1834_006563 [Cirrosporium novae-zelandiae]|nr:MAG: hypothetical protein M1834_006563 [Cirrosporium novae-zelandiae]